MLLTFKMHYFTTSKYGTITHLAASVYVSVCPVWALTFESLNLEASFCHAGTSLDYLGQVRISKPSGRGQGL